MASSYADHEYPCLPFFTSHRYTPIRCHICNLRNIIPSSPSSSTWYQSTKFCVRCLHPILGCLKCTRSPSVQLGYRCWSCELRISPFRRHCTSCGNRRDGSEVIFWEKTVVREYAGDELEEYVTEEAVGDEEVGEMERDYIRQQAAWSEGIEKIERNWVDTLVREMNGEPKIRACVEVKGKGI